MLLPSFPIAGIYLVPCLTHAAIVQEISHCAVNHRANGCAGSPVPAMVYQCAQWEACMNRDPTSFERSRLFAATVADVWNAFIEPITLKTFVRPSPFKI